MKVKVKNQVKMKKNKNQIKMKKNEIKQNKN